MQGTKVDESERREMQMGFRCRAVSAYWAVSSYIHKLTHWAFLPGPPRSRTPINVTVHAPWALGWHGTRQFCRLGLELCLSRLTTVGPVSTDGPTETEVSADLVKLRNWSKPQRVRDAFGFGAVCALSCGCESE